MRNIDMVQIAIVEDDPAERARLRECLDYLEKTEQIRFGVEEYENGEAFLLNYHPGLDIVFMDIEMPGMDGMETARALRKSDGAVILIFVTNLAQYAIFGYDVEALDFIIKPINKYSFALKVKRAVSRCSKKTDEFILVKTEGESLQLRIASIRYLEVSGHYVIYHTLEGDHTEYTTLKDVEGRIDRTYFVHCNRSFLVNLHHVTSVTRDSVHVGTEELQISRPQKKAFLAALSEFMGGRT